MGFLVNLAYTFHSQYPRAIGFLTEVSFGNKFGFKATPVPVQCKIGENRTLAVHFLKALTFLEDELTSFETKNLVFAGFS